MEADINDSTRPIDHSELHQRVLELQKAQRDTHSPISTVPNEVLLEIFTVLQTSCDIAEWHHVTHVCQLWRYLVLGAANLWTQPPMDCHEYTVAMLERSHSAPLDITIALGTYQTTWDEIFKHTGRIRSLRLDHRKEVLESLQHALVDPSLRLRALQVSHSFPFVYKPPSQPPYKLTLNTPNTSSLQVLQISHIDMDWQIFPIRSLTALFMIDMLMSIPPSWIQLLRALDGMPLLTELVFELSCLHLTSPGPTLPAPLQMPHLREMVIAEGTASAITYFLSNTVFPQLRRVAVRCTSCDSDEFEALVDIVISKADMAHLNSLSLTEKHLQLEQKAPMAPQWHLSRSRLDFRYPTMSNGIASMLRLVRHITTNSAINFTSRIVNMGLNANLTSEQLVELFGYSFPNLKLIQLFSISQTLVEGLVIPSTHPPNETIPFRNLREIRLEATGDSSLYTPELLTALRECLATRRERHSPVTKAFLKCDLTANQVSELQELVGELEIWEHAESEDEVE